VPLLKRIFTIATIAFPNFTILKRFRRCSEDIMASRREQMQEHIESPEWTESGLENVFRFYPGLLLQRGGIIQQTETTALPPCTWCINWLT